MAVRIVMHAFEIVHLLTDSNPIQVLVDAIVNTGPREDSTRIGSAGTVRRQAVDVSPLRRVNQSVALITIGVRESSFRNVKSISECLADELINAAKGSSNSYAIKKKDELEVSPALPSPSICTSVLMSLCVYSVLPSPTGRWLEREKSQVQERGAQGCKDQRACCVGRLCCSACFCFVCRAQSSFAGNRSGAFSSIQRFLLRTGPVAHLMLTRSDDGNAVR